MLPEPAKDAFANWSRPSIPANRKWIILCILFSIKQRNIPTNQVAFTRFEIVHWITRPLTPSTGDTLYQKLVWVWISLFRCVLSVKENGNKWNFTSQSTISTYINTTVVYYYFAYIFLLVFHEKLVLLWFSASSIFAGCAQANKILAVVAPFITQMNRWNEKEKKSLEASKVKGGFWANIANNSEKNCKQTSSDDDWITISHSTVWCRFKQKLFEEILTWNTAIISTVRSLLAHQLHHFTIITIFHTYMKMKQNELKWKQWPKRLLD